MFDQHKPSPYITVWLGLVIVVNGICISPANMRSLSLRGPTNCFPMAAASASREVVGDAVREVIGLPALETIGGRITTKSLEMQTLTLTLGMFTRVTLVLLKR